MHIINVVGSINIEPQLRKGFWSVWNFGIQGEVNKSGSIIKSRGSHCEDFPRETKKRDRGGL